MFPQTLEKRLKMGQGMKPLAGELGAEPPGFLSLKRRWSMFDIAEELKKLPSMNEKSANDVYRFFH